jgi:hypothetical protein
MGNNKTHRSTSATNPGPRPGDFPLGSPQSRAAARAQLEEPIAALLEVFHAAVARGESKQFLDTISEDNVAGMLAVVKRERRRLSQVKNPLLLLEEAPGDAQ